MVEIVSKEKLCENTYKIEVFAPLVAAKARAGQFIIVRPFENSERIPLTVADYDREKGTVTVIYQTVGTTTAQLAQAEEEDYLASFVGPLGRASELDGIRRALVIGGGLGCAIAYPQAKALKENGASVDMIAGFRNESLVILKKEMESVSDNLYIMTDDGSFGERVFVTEKLKALVESGCEYDAVITSGPLPMMKAVSALTRNYNLKTIVSMNPIMIDGTGMCGGCRLTVGGEVKFACVDGPDFDGHKVDFDEVIRRNAAYRAEERKSYDSFCNLMKGWDE